MACRDILRQWFTESDNKTHDLARVLAALSILTGLGLSVYSVVWRLQTFDMSQFGGGIGMLFAGVAVALGFKKETPP